MQNQFTRTRRLLSRVVVPCLLTPLAILTLLACDRETAPPQEGAPEAQSAERSRQAAASLDASRAAPLPRVELDAPRSIVLISVDTLRPDHLSLYGYARNTSPAIDRYFAQASIYRRAYSAEANTSPSVVSMLTGLYPARHRVRLLYQRIPAEVHVLSDYLSAAGYQTAAVVSNIVLTREAIGLSTRFDHYDDFVDEREGRRLNVYERRASRTTDAAIQWLAESRDPGRPHLLWVHYIDPHGPYAPPEGAIEQPFRSETPHPIDPSRVVPYQRNPKITDGRRYIDRYDDEIAYADAEIGRLLEAYEELPGADESIVVFTADHGENMIEHDIYFNHGHQVWDSIMRVPLMIRWPKAGAQQIDVPVSLVDLAPTLLEAVGYPPESFTESFDGKPLHARRLQDSVSLEASGSWGTGQPQTWEYRHHRALVSGQEKWFTSVDRKGELIARGRFDLAQDPAETSPQPWHFGAEGNELLRWFEADPDKAGRPAFAIKGWRIDAPKVAPGRTPEELRALRALGYVE
ncbi:MAG: sulfatase [bacterium]|nr:sulfatase [bacterium]